MELVHSNSVILHMADPKQQEPSIEEILSSIRQIISDDKAPEASEPGGTLKAVIDAPPAPSDLTLRGDDEERYDPSLTLKGEAEETFDGGDLDDMPIDLTEIVDDADDDQNSPIDLQVASDTAVDEILNAPPIPPNAPKITMQEHAMDLMSAQTAVAAESAIAKLAENLYVNRADADKVTPPTGPTLEDIVRSLLKPMLREWIDANLPSLVERLVQSEIEKITGKLK